MYSKFKTQSLLVVVLFITLTQNSLGQEVVWQENFDDCANMQYIKPGVWTGTNTIKGSGYCYAWVRYRQLVAHTTKHNGSESRKAEWYTNKIDLSEYKSATVSFKIYGTASTHDVNNQQLSNGYLLLQYSIDGVNWYELDKLYGNIPMQYLTYNLPIGNNVVFRLEAIPTELYKGVTYKIDNIVITGVKKDRVLWLRADKGVDPNGGIITEWRDQSGSKNNAYSSFYYYDRNYKYVHDGHNDYNNISLNYNPGVKFKYNKIDSEKQIMIVPDNNELDVGELSIFAVVNPISTDNYDAIISKHSNSYDSGFGLQYISDGKNLKLVFGQDAVDNNSSDNVPCIAVTNSPQLISATYDKDKIFLSTEEENVTKSYNFPIKSNDFPVTIGADHTTLSQVDIFEGDINEILLYNYAVSGEEKDKIESYLALKYGITLKHDYKLSNGDIVYTSGSYNQDIAGIATDYGYNLEQKISSSINKSGSEGSSLTISTENNFNSPNVEVLTSLSNSMALVWGKNNSKITGMISDWIIDGDYRRTSELWKFQNTGVVNQVYLQINLSNYNSFNYCYYLVIDKDEDLSNGVDREYMLTEKGSNVYQTALILPVGISYMRVVLKCTDPKDSLKVALPDNLNVCEGESLDIQATGASGGTGTYIYDFYVKPVTESNFKDVSDQSSNNDNFPYEYSVTSDLKVIIKDELECVCTPVIKHVTVRPKIKTKEIVRK